MNARNFIAKNYINAVGWRTPRKLLLIESDDWGAIRMPSKQVAQTLFKNEQDKLNYFDKNDCLESGDDLTALYDVLSSFKDKNGNPAVLSAESVVCNPNFEAIQANGYTQYVPESIVETYQKYPGAENTYSLFMQGIKDELIYPQFHSREHIHVARWMEAINSDNRQIRLEFENRAILSTHSSKGIREGVRVDYFCSFDYLHKSEESAIADIIHDGLMRFELLFGFKTKSYVSPTSLQGLGINKIFADAGVPFCQCGQQFWRQENGSIKVINYRWGQKDKDGVTFWRRNCMFEPSRNQNLDWVDSCLREIAIAFFWGKPAVINSHRVNYIGGIHEMNRTQTLKQLNRLLTEVTKRWPEVEFIHSAQLADILSADANKF